MTTPKTVLGGEDVRAIIADCGSWVTRVGSAGEDTPRAVMPSVVGTPRSSPCTPTTSTQDSDVKMTDSPAAASAPPALPKPLDTHGEFVGASKRASRAGDALLTSPLAFTDVQSVYEFEPGSGRARVRDWDGMQAMWEVSCEHLRLTPRTSPLLIVEPGQAWDDADRAKALERAFEGLGTPAAYVARGAAMTAFASGRTTACVVDVGHQGAVAVPVVDGYTLQKGKVTSSLGGRELSERLRQWTEGQLAVRKGYDGGAYNAEVGGTERLRAHHELKRVPLVADAGSRMFRTTDLSVTEKQRGLTASHRAFYRMRVIEDLKVSTFRVSQGKSIAAEEGGAGGKDAPKGAAGNGAPKTKSGKKEDGASDGGFKTDPAPEKDGSTANGSKSGNNGGSNQKSRDSHAGASRETSYELPDGNTVSLSEGDGLSIADELFATSESGTVISLPELAFRAVSNSDVDCRRDLFAGVVLSGGTSLIPGALERFSRELAVRTPQMYKLKVLAATNSVERSCGAWIGGSIVASLGTFQQAWVSKAEYDELGSLGALRKCP